MIKTKVLYQERRQCLEMRQIANGGGVCIMSSFLTVPVALSCSKEFVMIARMI